MEFGIHSTAKEACTTISQLKSLLQSKSLKLKSADMKLKAFECELPNLFVRKDGVVCHHDKNGAIQIVVPRKLIPSVLEMMHNQLGHLGFKKTLQRTKDKYFWPHMSLEIEDWCRKCEECQQRKNPIPKQRAPLQPISTSRPGELVTMDIVEYAQSSQGYRYCLVVVDHFTKWLELFPLRNQKAETIAKKIFDGWIPRHGTLEQLHHDQGKNLTADIIQEVCSFLQIWKKKARPSTHSLMAHQRGASKRLTAYSPK